MAPSACKNALQGNFQVDYVVRYTFAGAGKLYSSVSGRLSTTWLTLQIALKLRSSSSGSCVL